MNNLLVIIFFNELELIGLHTSITIVFAQLSKMANRSQKRPEGSLFNSYNTKEYGGYNFFAWIVPLTLDLYLILLSVKQGDIK